MSESVSQWFEFKEVADVPSPALLVYRDRVRENIRRMLSISGGPDHLRPHIKTHKMREVLDLQLLVGIKKFKCATIAEAELAATAGVPDLLLAYQPVGPAIRRFAELIKTFRQTKFLSRDCFFTKPNAGRSSCLRRPYLGCRSRNPQGGL